MYKSRKHIRKKELDLFITQINSANQVDGLVMLCSILRTHIIPKNKLDIIDHLIQSKCVMTKKIPTSDQVRRMICAFKRMDYYLIDGCFDNICNKFIFTRHQMNLILEVINHRG